MDIKEQIEIVKALIEATKTLNGEFQDGWEDEIKEGERLLQHLKRLNELNSIV